MDTKELVEVVVYTWNARDKDGFAAVFDEDCEITIPGGVVLRGAEGAQMFWHGYQDAFPDNQVVLRTAFGSDDAGTEEAVFEGHRHRPAAVSGWQRSPRRPAGASPFPSSLSTPSVRTRSSATRCTSTRSSCSPSSLSDALLDSFCLIGPLSRCRERLAEYREAGVDLPILNPPIGPAAALDLIKAFAGTATPVRQP